MKINVTNTLKPTVPFYTLNYGDTFMEDEDDFNVSTGEMLLIKCETGTDSCNNAIYLDDGSATYVRENKEVYRVNARIEVEF